MHPSRSSQTLGKQQRGAAFIVMLVIMIMGITIGLVGALSKVTLQTARNDRSADLLAQAKEIVIGYALNGTGSSQRPGDLMRPDVAHEATPNYDGTSETGCLDSTISTPNPGLPLTTNPSKIRCFGRLPWKSYGFSIESPSENDPIGYMPWYAVSKNLYDYPATPLNSELLNKTTGWITVRDINGNVLSNRVVFVIIIPGVPLPGQSRPVTPILGGANQYLDSVTVPVGCTTPCMPGTYNNFDMRDEANTNNGEFGFVTGDEHRWIDDPANPGKQIEDPTYQFNDKLLYVTIDELMPLIEKRIAREVKSCLDDYAAWPTNTNHRYPWATLVSDTTAYPDRTGIFNVHFGRVSDKPSISTTNGGTTPTGTLYNNIQAVQTALSNYLSNPTSGNLSTLSSKGDILKDYASSIGQSTTDPARAAGITADGCNGSTTCTDTLQSQLDAAMGLGTPDPTMPSSWTTIPSCKRLFNTSTYWPEWRDLVFYQVAEGYQPGGGTFTPLHISGSGNTSVDNNTYRAAVVIAGKWLTGQSTRPTTNSPTNNYYVNNYLEVGNNHQSQTAATPSVNFTTYKPSDTTNYSTVNDLVLCVDGKINCQ